MRLLNTLRPTTFQKQVLAHITGAPTPKLAAANIATNRNLMAARDMLAKLGIITYSDAGAALTDKGITLATEENITDETGQLTDEGSKLIAPPGQEQPGQEQQPPADPTNIEPGPDATGVGGDVSLESFSLLKELLTN